MIITCPNCETQYFADDATIGESGRTVKCASCEHSWFVSLSKDAPGGKSPSGGAHEAYREKVRARRRKASRTAAVMAWLVVATMFLAAIGGTFIFRNRVVEYWPQSAEAFKTAGLEVNRYGLEFRDTSAERYFDGTTPVLRISGTAENTSRRARPATYVRVILLDEQGAPIEDSFAPLEPAQVPPGKTASFLTELENPPFEAFELELQFATKAEVESQSGEQSVAEASTPADAASSGEDQQ